ncbi:unnamed protein product [Victoria cruziana]
MAHDRRKKRSESSESSSSSSDTDSREEKSKKRRRTRRERGHKHQRKEASDSEDFERKGKKKDRKKRKEHTGSRLKPDKAEKVVRYMLKKFPDARDDLKHILQMIDEGQAVDLGGLTNSYLAKLLEKLFQYLNLKQNKVGGIESVPSSFADVTPKTETDDVAVVEKLANPDLTKRVMGPHMPSAEELASAIQSQPQKMRRVIGPEMPSAEELSSASMQSEPHAIRSDELDDDNDVLIGPPPPNVVAEAESANEAERFDEVSRIVAGSIENPYEVLGLNRNTTHETIKKRYWKLSLLVHPDKCSHPQAHQAFVLLNQAFKELQDPNKRKLVDEKLLQKEELEEFKAELQAHREAAKWRQLRGESLPGDEELLAGGKQLPRRDEWMTTLPPERAPGLSMHSTSFSKGGKEGRGDTSLWTETPEEMARKAKMRNLVTHNTTALADDETTNRKNSSSDAELVDAYQSSKRSKSLLQKHQEASSSVSGKKQNKETVKEDWVGQHPWKPWNRETDLSAGRQKVDLDPKNMAQGLASRFSSGSFQRNFL